MSNEQDRELKKERAKGYALGYAAGKRRNAADAQRMARYREDRVFWERAFICVSEHFAGCAAWSRGDKKLNGLEERAGLAAKWANEALKHRQKLT